MLLNHNQAWKSADLDRDTSLWQYRLDDADKKEIAAALEFYQAHPSKPLVINQAIFPLAKLKEKLAEIAEVVEARQGLFLLRGLPVNDYSAEEQKLIYMGLCSYIGMPVRQSREGELIHDVMDHGQALTAKNGRGTATKDPLPFHTDRADVVTLLCLRQAKYGGASRVVSAVAIHDEIAKRSPELLELLFQPYYHARVGWETTKENDFYQLPVFNYYQGYFATRYLRHFINLAQTIPGVPTMSEQQVAALDLVESIANDPHFCADMDFEPGDIQILNNFVVLHSRAGYEDDPQSKRHLLRMWLAVPNSRPLADSFIPLFGSVEPGAIRGGVPLHSVNL